MRLMPMDRIADRFDQLFSAALRDFPAREVFFPVVPAGHPPVNLWQDEEAYHLEAELPGVLAEDLAIEVKGTELTLAGERKRQHPEGVSSHRSERSFGRFVRRIKLPGEVDADRVDAKLTDGVLTLTLPKAAAHRIRKIAVNRG
jgi:HSP20 family protein